MTTADRHYPVSGAGIGLRRGLLDKLMQNPPDEVDFMEVAPENWIHVGGSLAKKFRFFTERYPFLIHGLSLSIGAPSPLNETLLRDVKAFMKKHGIRYYSEHLSYTGRRTALRPDANPVYRGSGHLRCEPHSTRTGHTGAAHGR